MRFAATSMLSRLKTPSVVLGGGGGTPSGGGSGGSGGMRKLSSSPHLLGICEEGEEESGQWTVYSCIQFILLKISLIK